MQGISYLFVGEVGVGGVCLSAQTLSRSRSRHGCTIQHTNTQSGCTLSVAFSFSHYYVALIYLFQPGAFAALQSPSLMASLSSMQLVLHANKKYELDGE